MYRLFAVVCVVLALSCSAQELIDQLYEKAGGGQPGIETKYRRVKGAKAGLYLAENFAGKRVLILLPPEMPIIGKNEAEPAFKATVDGFQKGLGGKLTIVGMIEPKLPAAIKAKLQAVLNGNPQGMAMMPEGQMWFDVPALNKALAPFKGKYDLLVCLTHLPGVDVMPGMPGQKQPVTFDKLDFWLDEKVNVVLLEGGVNRYGPLIQVGKIAAVATYKRSISDEAFEKEPPRDLEAAFNMRFVLITPKNLAQHMAYFRF